MQSFTQWLNESHIDDLVTDVFGADAAEVKSWLTQKFEPGDRPQIMFHGTQYQIIGEPDMPGARGKFIQARPLGAKHRGYDKLIPIQPLIAAAINP